MPDPTRHWWIPLLTAGSRLWIPLESAGSRLWIPLASGCPPATFERITTWNDANGAAFVVSGVGSSLRNSDVIYARASWAW